MLKSIPSLFPAFLLGGIFCLIFVGVGNSGYGDQAHIQAMTISEFAVNSSAKVLGLLVTIVGLLKLVQQLVKPDPAHDLVAPGMCVLGGTLLVASNWAVAIAFGVLALARIVERYYCTRAVLSSAIPNSGDSSQ